MEKNYVYEADKRDFFTQTYIYLGIGLLVNALVALLVSELIPYLGYGFVSVLFIVSAILELVLSFMIPRSINAESDDAPVGKFILFSAVNGVTLSSVFLAYTDASILFAFLTAAVVFFSLAAIGRTTKVNVTKFGSIFLIGLISCTVLSLLNVLIFRASGLELVLCYVETLLFMGLIVYDHQMLERYAQVGTKSLAVLGALGLELDFINLFLRILEIFGKRRDD